MPWIPGIPPLNCSCTILLLRKLNVCILKLFGLLLLLVRLTERLKSVYQKYISFFTFQILPAAKDYTTTKRNGCVKLRKEESGLGSEEPISVPTLLQDAAAAYPDVSF